MRPSQSRLGSVFDYVLIAVIIVVFAVFGYFIFSKSSQEPVDAGSAPAAVVE